MNDTSSELLVLGLGNVLLGDDGVGPAMVARLRDTHTIPQGARCVDGGTLGLSLLPYLEDARMVIMVDAVAADAPPGTLVRFEGGDVAPVVAARLSPHQIGVADLLDGARWHDRAPQKLVLLGIVPESIELGVGLSTPVLRSMPALLELVREETRACGFPLQPKREPHDPATFDVADLCWGVSP